MEQKNAFCSEAESNINRYTQVKHKWLKITVQSE